MKQDWDKRRGAEGGSGSGPAPPSVCVVCGAVKPDKYPFAHMDCWRATPLSHKQAYYGVKPRFRDSG